jgi:predicted nucleotidyltransferase component of viral defense system
MSSKAMKLKAKINNYAKKSHIAAQVVLQNYMFERFLVRLSKSEYRDKFVIKGGILIASIVGLDIRSTMDLDTTIKNLPLKEHEVLSAVKTIANIDIGDEIIFETKSISLIRKDDKYGGYCVRIDAIYDTMITALSIDISTGDVITPSAVQYEFSGIFDENLKINLWGYNIETVMAEKLETILSRGIFNTRPRDFYDIYILSKTQSYDQQLLKEALLATAEHRGSTALIADTNAILHTIEESSELINMWHKYQKKFPYANNISYQDILNVLYELL